MINNVEDLKLMVMFILESIYYLLFTLLEIFLIHIMRKNIERLDSIIIFTMILKFSRIV